MAKTQNALRALALSAALFIIAGSPAAAQVVEVPYAPQIGSANPSQPAPAVTRPGTTPCVVTLLKNQQFADFNAKSFTYTPPAACSGPWAKIVLTVDFTVTKGIQYDRTAEFFLGNINIFYGTTAEPGSALSPSWKVERDVTDLSALFKSAGTGAANIGNLVDSTYTGIIYATAKLQFYPASALFPAAAVPDLVVPVNTGESAATLSTTSSVLTQTLNLPRNVDKVYLDVIAQSQSSDEFWYFCVPSSLSAALESCGNTAFRETEVTIDGKPAGVAPIYPWIYTGGLDPYLWTPITGIQTLNFEPYRVDLTPFAALLSDGAAHTVGISVYNADSYFLVAANLLAFQDHGSKQITGGLVTDTLSAAPSPIVTGNLSTDQSGTTTGTLSVYSDRNFKIHGFVNTSHGRIDTSVEQDLSFNNAQKVDVNPNSGPDDQNIAQTTMLKSEIITRTGSVTVVREETRSYPLVIDYQFLANADGSYTQFVSAYQEYLLAAKKTNNGVKVDSQHIDEKVHSQDTLPINASGEISAAGSGTSHASYVGRDSDGVCFSRSLQSEKHVLTGVVTDRSCD